MKFISGGLLPLVAATLFATAPSSTNFTLKSYDFGTGGGESSSTNYRLDSSVGSQSGQTSTSTSFNLQPGEIPTQNANVPPAPTFVNPNNNYNRLRLTINTGGNPSDTRYAIAISSDNFASDTRYVQTDNTIGQAFTVANYQTYATWGGASGFWVLGLQPSTTYWVKVKAFQGNYTDSAFGPTANATTSQTMVSFSVETTATSSPPFNLSFSGLTPGFIFSADADAVFTIDSNALLGGMVYLRDSNAGLVSSGKSFTISSSTADLSSAPRGYGAQLVSASQDSGGPLNVLSPFDASGDNIAGLSTALQPLATTSGPITNGNVVMRMKAKASLTDPSATDYADTLTFVAAMIF